MVLHVVYGHAAPNDTPVIGILSQPLGVELGATSDADTTYIAASYVKFAESSGARVVPLHFDSSDAELTELFYQINGIIFPGGGADIKNRPGNRHRQAANILYNLAMQANDGGNPFPIHGTCLGFQMLALMAAENDEVLCEGCYTTDGTPMILNLTDAAATSRLFSDIPTGLLKAVTTQRITENSHVNGLEPKRYEGNTKLKEFYQILSRNTDPTNGKLFVSTMEGRRYPFSATQWHPEKNNFEWGKIGKLGYAAIPHSSDAVRLSQYVANNFVNRARQNFHRFSSNAALNSALIDNSPAVMDPQGYFSQIYQWPRRDPQGHSVIV